MGHATVIIRARRDGERLCGDIYSFLKSIGMGGGAAVCANSRHTAANKLNDLALLILADCLPLRSHVRQPTISSLRQPHNSCEQLAGECFPFYLAVAGVYLARFVFAQAAGHISVIGWGGPFVSAYGMPHYHHHTAAHNALTERDHRALRPC